jgi:hypothetical protein
MSALREYADRQNHSKRSNTVGHGSQFDVARQAMRSSFCRGSFADGVALAQERVSEKKVAVRGELPTAAAALDHSVALRYLEDSRIIVRGPVTGRSYDFPAAQPVHKVAQADSVALLGTGLFRSVG